MSLTGSLASCLRSVVPPGLRPIGYLRNLTQQRCGFQVRGGPFAGMRYIEDSVGSAYIPKLLGIYEKELHEAVQSACRLGFPLIVDVGAAEGYYAVGMALRNPTARVEAFEMDPEGFRALKRMSEINGTTDRVTVHGKCEPADLELTLRGELGRKLLICDVEGYEEVLLDLEAVPSLISTWVLVELHEFIRRGIGSLLKERLSQTHRITHIWQDDRSRTEYPFQTFGTTVLPRRYLDWAVSEWRPERMSWLWMEPVTADAAG